MKLVWLAAIAAVGMSTFAAGESSPERLSVHEWGTFTVLQDERGQAIGGVNTDDEPVPPFVHTLDSSFIQNANQPPEMFAKGLPQCDPSITVRLETPVVYFHPAAGFNAKIDVDVQFRGGWLTQYYPDAAFSAPGLEKGIFKYDSLSERTLGSLAWHGLTLTTSSEGPVTKDPVWLAPRKVDAAGITAASGESERFIFYRGVGHVQTPVHVSRIDGGRRLHVQSEPGISAASVPALGDAWLVDVRDDGRIALRTVRGDERGQAVIEATFSADQYASDPSELRKALHSALVAGGLFSDEAEALLNTWDASYFRRSGLRLFYLVPREWTDSVLPLRVSSSGKPLDARIERVMVGRIELVTPEQRKQLSLIGKGPASTPNWLFQETSREHSQADWYGQMMSGRIPVELANKIPADYRAYIALGRFRASLVLDELANHPSAGLKNFVSAYGLAPAVSR